MICATLPKQSVQVHRAEAVNRLQELAPAGSNLYKCTEQKAAVRYLEHLGEEAICTSAQSRSCPAVARATMAREAICTSAQSRRISIGPWKVAVREAICTSAQSRSSARSGSRHRSPEAICTSAQSRRRYSNAPASAALKQSVQVHRAEVIVYARLSGFARSNLYKCTEQKYGQWYLHPLRHEAICTSAQSRR